MSIKLIDNISRKLFYHRVALSYAQRSLSFDKPFRVTPCKTLRHSVVKTLIAINFTLYLYYAEIRLSVKVIC